MNDLKKSIPSNPQRQDDRILSARIEVDVDCGNCSIGKEEIVYIKQEIERLVKNRGMKVEKITIYG